MTKAKLIVEIASYGLRVLEFQHSFAGKVFKNARFFSRHQILDEYSLSLTNSSAGISATQAETSSGGQQQLSQDPQRVGSKKKSIPKIKKTLKSKKDKAKEEKFPQEDEELLAINGISVRAIATLIKKHYPLNSGIYFNLASNETFIRQVHLPFSDAKKVKEILPYEIESLLPFEQEQIHFQAHLYPSHDEDEETTGLVVGTQKAKLIEWLNVFKQHQIKVLDVYSPIDALFQIACLEKSPTKVMLHLGAFSSMLLYVENFQAKFGRLLPIGTDSLLQKVMQISKCDPDESENLLGYFSSMLKEGIDVKLLKEQYQLGSKQVDEILKECENFAHKLKQEMQVSLKPLLVDFDDESAMNLFISTDFSNQLLLENMIIPGSPFVSRVFPYESTPVATIGREFMICVAAGFSVIETKGLRFLTKDLKKYVYLARHDSNKAAIILTAAGILLFIGAVVMNYQRKVTQLNKLTTQNATLFQRFFQQRYDASQPLSMIAQAEQIVERKKGRLNVNAKYGGKKLAVVLYELHELLKSEQVKIEAIDFTAPNNNLKITGVCDDYNSFNFLKKALADSNLYEPNIQQSNVAERPDKQLKNKIGFVLQLKYKN